MLGIFSLSCLSTGVVNVPQVIFVVHLLFNQWFPHLVWYFVLPILRWRLKSSRVCRIDCCKSLLSGVLCRFVLRINSLSGLLAWIVHSSEIILAVHLIDNQRSLELHRLFVLRISGSSHKTKSSWICVGGQILCKSLFSLYNLSLVVLELIAQLGKCLLGSVVFSIVVLKQLLFNIKHLSFKLGLLL